MGSELGLSIDPDAAEPPFEQLKGQLVERMERGHLSVGERLPSVRALASEVGLAPNTVARAYRELEQGGFVRTAGRNGTVVADREHDPATLQRADELAREYAKGMRALGFGAEAAVDRVRGAWG